MYLPPYVENCISALEAQGFAAYAVGGCVRDALLGLTPHDYDLCTAARPEQIKAIFAGHNLVLAGEKHGTVGVVTQGEVVEITTFRQEGDYLDNRHPERVDFVTDVTQDLARRDFTVNAMAYSPSRGFADPFGGRQDLTRKVLRAVGEPAQRFREDSLRILRGVRFAVRFGLETEEATGRAMEELAPLMDNLARERVMEELCKLLPAVQAEDLLRYAPILCQVIPELAPTVGFQQRNPHHIYDVYTHTAHVVAAVPPKLHLRWAALLHDVGKPETFTVDDRGNGHFYGHGAQSARMADGILRRLKASNDLRERVVTLVEQHMTRLQADKKQLRRWLSRLGEEMLWDLLDLQAADFGGKGVEAPEDQAEIRQLLAEILAEESCLGLKDLAVNGRDLMALGYVGPEIGRMLQRLLERVLDEQIPNDKAALLAAAERERGTI